MFMSINCFANVPLFALALIESPLAHLLFGFDGSAKTKGSFGNFDGLPEAVRSLAAATHNFDDQCLASL
jgi:hypothetical protein